MGWLQGFQQSNQRTVLCGVLADCRTVWRHGCRHRASREGFTACPASGEDSAHSMLSVCCRALARPPSQDTPQVRPCRLRRGIHAAQGPATVSGQGPRRDGRCARLRAVLDAPCSTMEHRLHVWCTPHERQLSDECRPTVWGGVLAGCGTVWRHGCRHRAPKDGFTACPASGEGTAPSTLRVLLKGPCPTPVRTGIAALRS
ncbi:hypothetical protein FHY16_000474 [Xanthomonas campestris]|nr:hypothetical protein [Xanthomonas euroxanthea]